MAGFGAGFGKAFGSSLEAAGKLHQEEQLRTREYERAKADRQAERLEYRAWQQKDADTRRKQQIEDRDWEQGIKDEDNPDRVVLRGGKYYFIKRDGSEKELTSDSPLVTGYLRAKKEASQKDTLFNLTVSEKKSNIRQSNAAAASRREGGPKVEMSKIVDAFAESLAKNKKVFARSAADMASFTNILRDYGFKNGADLGREYMNSNPRAREAMNLAQDHLYFPEESELNDKNRIINQPAE